MTVTSPQPSAYSALIICGIIASLLYWRRHWKKDERLFYIYLGGLVAAFTGAKLVYFLSEGWLFIGKPGFWPAILTGKSVVGALLGGYAGAEWVRRQVNYPGFTGDFFAAIVPAGIAIGRIGCLLHGCCLGVVCESTSFSMTDKKGVSRWPAVPVEIIFNLLILGVLAALRHRRILPFQHFHLYLVAYGVFRFFHEFLRDTPRILVGLSGYQIASAMMAGFGFWAFQNRQKLLKAGAITSNSTQDR
ncbi:MAG: hypothetical protein JWN25_806 [Verrucomicrobiales bacterium]|nr:hypothetical protein [Verrucomicrobiales bacterium]